MNVLKRLSIFSNTIESGFMNFYIYDMGKGKHFMTLFSYVMYIKQANTVMISKEASTKIAILDT